MKKIFCIMFVACLVFVSAVCVSADNALPVIEQGTINSGDGNTRDEATRIRTADFIKISDYKGIEIGEGFELTNFVFDSDKKYLGTSGWLGNGVGFATNKLSLVYPDAAFFKFAIRRTSGGNIAATDIEATGLEFYTEADEMPQSLEGQNSESDFTFENGMSIGFCQEGAIFNGKLFALAHDGKGAVYDLSTQKKVSDITLDKYIVIAPHANSVCFGAQYYDENDKYPLLYVNVYNNYKDWKDRREGICCVYRVLEEGDSFKTQLVQVIKIGFTEDLELWKSLPHNADVRPYGNFVVDTDNNALYAFVMRDKQKETRFFKFDVPNLEQGKYNLLYGCNEVTLNVSDIKEQFDTEYFNFMQGCDYTDGKIISAEGFGKGGGAEPAIRVVDLNSKTVAKTYYPSDVGLSAEPEIVAVDNQNGDVYYMAGDGVLRKLTCIKGKGVSDGEKLVSKHDNTNAIVRVCIIIAVAVLVIGVAVIIIAAIIKKRRKN